jgi:fibronectin-binding autotransporter adhesin
MSYKSARGQRTVGLGAVEARKRRRMQPNLTALEDRRLMSTFTVTSTLDDGSAGTLRYEIGQANTNAGPDAIDFDSTVFSTPQTIALTSGQLELTDAATTTITGPGSGLLSISGNNASRVFSINYGSAALSGLTITGGNASTGGGLYNESGTATLTNCTVSGNSATKGGGVFTGGVYNYYNGYTYSGVTTLTNCTVSGVCSQNRFMRQYA